MHVIINILFDCKLRNIYGLKWTTTSKRSSPPRGREWKICLNMKVVKWVAAHTGMFIKRSVKTGKTHAIDRFTHSTRFYCQCVCAGCSYVSGELCCYLCPVWLFLFSWAHFKRSTPKPTWCISLLCAGVHVLTCSCVHTFTWAGVYMLRCSAVFVFRNALVQDAMFTCVHLCSVVSAGVHVLICAEVLIFLKALQMFRNASCFHVQKFLLREFTQHAHLHRSSYAYVFSRMCSYIPLYKSSCVHLCRSY